ncbi:MAG: hypothetical protein JWO11_3540 [Nocardioides sp.]|nr:hypothetical protein [Nocardioides sp.]
MDWLIWLVGAVVVALLAVVTYAETRRPPPPVAPTRRPAKVASVEPDLMEPLRQALRKVGHGELQVVAWSPIPAGVRATLRVPSKVMCRSNAQQGLSGWDAEKIAVALAEVTGQDICSDWVQLEKTSAAGTYELTVVGEDVMARTIPFVDQPEWADVSEPRIYGYRLDGEPYRMRINTHSTCAGATGSGKTAFLHAELAEETRTRNLAVWVAGTWKLYDLVAGWVEPYADTGLPLPLDWVASGQRDTVDTLVALLRIARWRQCQPMAERDGFTTIIIHLDEASYPLRNRVTRGEYMGVEHTASQLAAKIAQGAGSARVWIKFASQRGVSDHLGDQGADTRANAGYTAIFRTRDPDDVGRLTGDHKLLAPRHAGEYLLSSDAAPVRLKVPYLQSVDPNQPRLHAGLTVADVAWSRRHFTCGLDAGSAAAAGPEYARRHVRMDAAMRAYLTGSEIEAVGPSAAHRAGYDQAMKSLKLTKGVA